MLAPNRVNALVFGGFAGVALLIAVVRRGRRAGVLGERAYARVRDPARHRIDAAGICWRGSCARAPSIGVGGIVAGAIGGVLLARLVGSFVVPTCRFRTVVPIAGAAAVLVVAAIVASLTPAARASRVDVLRALQQVTCLSRSYNRLEQLWP